MQDLYDEKILREKLEVVLKEKNQLLTKVYGRLAMAPEPIVESCLAYAERLGPHRADTAKLLDDALRAGKHVMLEGAQGTMLDLDHGTYPFVTSSTPVTGYALASAGIGPQHVERVVGITKAYVTRVGSGPFPTEALDEEGERLGERGHEFGTTTGRKRRCGWFDGMVLRAAARLNGLTELVLTKLDVLSGFEAVKVCVGYRVAGEVFDDVPPTQTQFHHAEPVWEELPGLGRGPRRGARLRRSAEGGAGVRALPRGAGWRSGVGDRRGPRQGTERSGDRVKVLVVGGGGREHALVWRLSRDPAVTELLAAPGNPGIAELAACRPVASDDVARMVNLVDDSGPDLVVVGPEVPLVAGLADALEARGVAVFGPRPPRRGWRVPRRSRRICCSAAASPRHARGASTTWRRRPPSSTSSAGGPW